MKNAAKKVSAVLLTAVLLLVVASAAAFVRMNIRTGMDLFQNRITVANPYGYTENITAEELLERTSFEAYEDMPLLLRFGFAFGIFEKNTVFIPVRK